VALINPQLLDVIAKRQGISVKGVYPQITKIALETFLERDLAALVLATRRRININKFSTPAQRAAIRSHLAGGGNDVPPAASVPTVRTSANRSKAPKKRTKGNSVFVVHGRDESLRKSMFEFLRALGLNPMEWSTAVAHAKGGNPYIGDILDAAMAKVEAVIVLFSPDELAQLKQQFWGPDDKHADGQLAGQARPNVIFEAGLALGAHPEKTVIVQVGRVRAFSDIAGKHLVRLSQDKGRSDLANRLKKLGCPVVTTGEDWMNAGHFEPTEAKSGKPLRKKFASKRGNKRAGAA
jgi:predicted nucleotide-binding protein